MKTTNQKSAPLLAVSDLTKFFPLNRGIFSRSKVWGRALDGVSFTVEEGENFGLVGESGCGKTTLARIILRLIEPTAGRIEFCGTDITRLSRKEMRPLRRQMQIIFQDPYSSLDPRMKVADIVTEPLRAGDKPSRSQRRHAAANLLEKVGLGPNDLDKYPHEFSGGQRQRIGIARALCVRPRLIVADEPVSALDVSIQAQVLNLMTDLKDGFGLSYVFISHDLSVVGHICDRIAVMYLGRIVELAGAEVFSSGISAHPYTRALISAIPQADPRTRVRPPAMEGDVPNPADPPPGCAFHPRCVKAFDRCSAEKPPLTEIRPGHFVACWIK